MAIWGLYGDGVHDDGPVLRQLIADNPGGLSLPPGIFAVGTIAHPHNSAYQAALIIPGFYQLSGQGPGITTIKLLAGVPNQAYLALNLNFDGNSANDEYITFRDLTFDGNAANNNAGTTDANYGPTIWRARHIAYINCSFKNFYGTVTGGNGPNGTNGESYGVDTQFCTDVTYTDCRGYTDSGQGGDGFHCGQGCTGVSYVNCVAYGAVKGAGFAIGFNAGQISMHNCYAWQNAASGIDIEQCQDVFLYGCVAGASGANVAGYPYTSNQNLGNTLTGINLRACARCQVIGCQSINNGSHGLAFYQAAAQGLRVIGGRFTNNGIYGIFGDGNQGDVVIEGHPLLTGNTTGGLTPDNGTHKVLDSGQITSPAVPASTTATPNTYPFACIVALSGGTVTGVAVDGVTLYTSTPCTIYLPPWSSVTLTYSVAPSWNWVAA